MYLMQYNLMQTEREIESVVVAASQPFSQSQFPTFPYLGFNYIAFFFYMLIAFLAFFNYYYYFCNCNSKFTFLTQLCTLQL